jgi:hypothetical protein
MDTIRRCWAVLLDGHHGHDAASHLAQLTIGLLVVIATILLILIVGPDQ